MRGQQCLVDRDVFTPIPLEWLHVTVATLGPAASAPAGLDDALEEALTGPRMRGAQDGRSGISAPIDGPGDPDPLLLASRARTIARQFGVAEGLALTGGTPDSRPYPPKIRRVLREPLVVINPAI